MYRTVITPQSEFYPWFEVAIIDHLNREFESERLKYKIRTQINNEFPSLFHQHCLHSEMWSSLRSRIDSEVTSGIDRINHATTTQVSAIVENKDELTSIKNHIISDVNKKYNNFQLSLITKNEVVEASRNLRLDKMEKEIDSVKSGQFWTFMGGAVVGGMIGFFSHK